MSRASVAEGGGGGGGHIKVSWNYNKKRKKLPETQDADDVSSPCSSFQRLWPFAVVILVVVPYMQSNNTKKKKNTRTGDTAASRACVHYADLDGVRWWQ